MADGGAGQLGAALAFIDGMVEAIADRVIPVPDGCVVRSDELSNVWSLNHVRLTRPTSPDTAIRLADEHLADLSYRHIEVEAESTCHELEARFLPAGWREDRYLLMALRGSPPNGAGVAMVVEPEQEETVALHRRWLSEDPRIGERGVDELLEFARRQGAVHREWRFGVRAEDGTLASLTKLWSDGTTAQIEDVYTAPEHRNRGFARAAVSHAARVGRGAVPGLVFIVADADDWPQQLYARIGFRPIGLTCAFHRELGAPPLVG